MPQTFRNYAVREVFLSVVDNRNLATGHERMKEGDIITFRIPAGRCGPASMARGLWLWIQGPDTSVLDRFKDRITTETEDVDGEFFDKRRFCIPFKRLPAFVDLARVRDPSDIYQPFAVVAEATGEFLMNPRPLRVEGLVFDKETMRYL